MCVYVKLCVRIPQLIPPGEFKGKLRKLKTKEFEFKIRKIPCKFFPQHVLIIITQHQLFHVQLSQTSSGIF